MPVDVVPAEEPAWQGRPNTTASWQGRMAAKTRAWRDRQRPADLALMIFTAGLLLGWVVLGWYVAPVQWRNAAPDALTRDWQRQFVQLVADSYAGQPEGERNAERAASLIATLRLGDADRRVLLDEATRVNTGAAQIEHVRLLSATLQSLQTGPAASLGAGPAVSLGAGPAVSLGASPGSAGTGPMQAAGASTSIPPGLTTGPSGTVVAGLPGTVAGAPTGPPSAARTGGGLGSFLPYVIIALMAAAFALAWASRQKRPDVDERPRERVPGDAFAGGRDTAPASRAASRTVARTADATGAGTSPSTGQSTGPSSGAATFDLRAPFGHGARLGQTQPWRPGRIDLGDTVTVRFDARDERLVQTWLLYNERSGLVGGAGLQVQPMGNVNTLVLWARVQDDEDEQTDTPLVTIMSQAAYDDTVLRARLGDQHVIPAVPGEAATLETLDLALDVQVRDVVPPPEAGQLSLATVTLALTPRLTSGSVPAAASMEDFIVEDHEPPVPLRFRRE